MSNQNFSFLELLCFMTKGCGIAWFHFLSKIMYYLFRLVSPEREALLFPQPDIISHQKHQVSLLVWKTKVSTSFPPGQAHATLCDRKIQTTVWFFFSSLELRSSARKWFGWGWVILRAITWSSLLSKPQLPHVPNSCLFSTWPKNEQDVMGEVGGGV